MHLWDQHHSLTICTCLAIQQTYSIGSGWSVSSSLAPAQTNDGETRANAKPTLEGKCFKLEQLRWSQNSGGGKSEYSESTMTAPKPPRTCRVHFGSAFFESQYVNPFSPSAHGPPSGRPHPHLTVLCPPSKYCAPFRQCFDAAWACCELFEGGASLHHSTVYTCWI